MSECQITVTVRLPDAMEHHPLEVISACVLGALNEIEVDIRDVSCAMVERVEG